ncbi:MAG: hypothetical protein ACREOU_11040 [Candidatus Eiseniibacteriota bacterium]
MNPASGSSPPLWPRLGAGLPDLALGAAFLIAWVRPSLLPEDAIAHFISVMLLEFIVIHSAAIMGSVALAGGSIRKRLLGMLGMTAFYFLFVIGFALGFKSWWPVTSFSILIANRVSGMLLDPDPDGDRKKFLRRSWALSATAYLGFCLATVILPVPRFGLSDEVLENVSLPGSGLWIDEPWRVMAFGFLYFTAIGLSGLGGHRVLRGPVSATARPTVARVERVEREESSGRGLA